MTEALPMTAVEVLHEWFAADLTWHAFQTMSDDEMADGVLAALKEAGYAVVPLPGVEQVDLELCLHCGNPL